MQRSLLGSEFLEEVEHSIALIRRYPNAAPILHARARQRETNRFPYGLVYLVRESDIVIIAVAHLKRRPVYWRRRLDDIE